MKRLESLYKEWLKEMCEEMVRNLFLIYIVVEKGTPNMIVKTQYCRNDTFLLLLFGILELT